MRLNILTNVYTFSTTCHSSDTVNKTRFQIVFNYWFLVVGKKRESIKMHRVIKHNKK